MHESEEKFKKIFTEVLAPKLAELGFKAVRIKEGWMSPQILYERNGVWFSCDWDWRDEVLEMNFGKLHAYHDVMPRVIVNVPYDDLLKMRGIRYKGASQFKNYGDYFHGRFSDIVNSIGEFVGNYDQVMTEYHEYFQKRLGDDKTLRKAYHQFLSHLGGELVNGEVPRV